MTRRVVLGERGDGALGAWVSKPGFDANAALPSDALLLAITRLTEQLIMLGTVNGLPAVVPFGFANTPYVFLTSTNLSLAIATGGSGGTGVYTTVSGMFARPYPPVGAESLAVQAAVSAAQMTITGGSSVVGYAVYRRRVS